MIEVDRALGARLRAMRSLGAGWWTRYALSATVVGTIVAAVNVVVGGIPAGQAAVRGAGVAIVLTCMFAWWASLKIDEGVIPGDVVP